MSEQGNEDRVRDAGSTAADQAKGGFFSRVMSSRGKDDYPDDETRTEERDDTRTERLADDAPTEERDREDSQVDPDEPTTAEDAPRVQDSDDDAGQGSADAQKGDDDPRDTESDEERREREEKFAAEHDPEQHDVAAGEEVRQPGDWTAEDAGGPQVWDADGNLVEGEHPGHPGGATGDESSSGDAAQAGSGDGTDGRRISSIDEIRDGGYGVGSAAPFDDGAQPLDHDVKAWEDTKTYLAPGEQGYDGVDPDVWFYDGAAAEFAGFRHAD